MLYNHRTFFWDIFGATVYDMCLTCNDVFMSSARVLLANASCSFIFILLSSNVPSIHIQTSKLITSMTAILTRTQAT